MKSEHTELKIKLEEAVEKLDRIRKDREAGKIRIAVLEKDVEMERDRVSSSLWTGIFFERRR